MDILTIEVSNLRGTRGTVRASIWNSDQAFMKDKPAGYAEGEISGSKVVLHVANLAQGTYAIAAYQDENDNGQLDSGFMGIPKEPYGFSGKSKSMFGPPAFRDASFAFPEQTLVSVRLKY